MNSMDVNGDKHISFEEYIASSYGYSLKDLEVFKNTTDDNSTMNFLQAGY